MTCRIPRKLPRTRAAAIRLHDQLWSCRAAAARSMTSAGLRQYKKIDAFISRLKRRWVV